MYTSRRFKTSGSVSFRMSSWLQQPHCQLCLSDYAASSWSAKLLDFAPQVVEALLFWRVPGATEAIQGGRLHQSLLKAINLRPDQASGAALACMRCSLNSAKTDSKSNAKLRSFDGRYLVQLICAASATCTQKFFFEAESCTRERLSGRQGSSCIIPCDENFLSRRSQSLSQAYDTQTPQHSKSYCRSFLTYHSAHSPIRFLHGL